VDHISTAKNLGIAALVALSALSAAACGTSMDAQFVHSEEISKSTFKGTWPAIPDSGVLACDSSKGNAVTFIPAGDNTTYAVNGSASGGWAEKEGWKQFEHIWLTAGGGQDDTRGVPRVDVGDFINEGLKLRGGNATSAASVTNTSSSDVPASAQPLSPAVDKDRRGYLSLVAFWNQNFTAATSADCTGEGADSLYSQHEWRLPGGGLVCSWGPLYNDAWGGRIESFQLYFDPHVDAQTAPAAAASILPADTQQVDSREAVNRSDTKYPDGSCQLVTYASNTPSRRQSAKSVHRGRATKTRSMSRCTPALPLTTVPISIISPARYVSE
jgi:hypothetical protein